MTGDSRASETGGCGSEGCGCRGGAGEPSAARGGDATDATRGDHAVGAARDDAPRTTPNGTTRRDFLKVLGVTGAGAATVGCAPDLGGSLLPYLVQEEEIVPGVARTYATVLPDQGPEPLAVHARVREGRVIKLEGNPDFPTTRGRLSALAQSALQDLYDPDRVATPLRATEPVPEEEDRDEEDPRERFEELDWDRAMVAFGEALGEGPTVLLTGPATGTAARFLEEWTEAVGAEHLAFDAFDHAPIRTAHQIAFGSAEIPSYALERADRIVCFGADFLGTWLAPVELSRRFAGAREVDEGRHAKFTFVGPRLSLTGTNADEWIRARSGTEGAVALAVARIVAERRGQAPLPATEAYTPEAAAEASGVEAEAIRRLGEELAEAQSPVALPPGSEAQGPAAAEMHLAVALLNQALGAYGRTVELGAGPVRGASAGLPELTELMERMRAGEVGTMVVAGANPVFALPAAAGFADALRIVPRVVAITPHLDETAAAAHLVLPSHHALESWGDVEVGEGVRALAQPVMRPIFDSRQREDILLEAARAAGAPTDFAAEDFAAYLREAWREEHGRTAAAEPFEDWWVESLRRGGRYPEVEEPAGPATTAGTAAGAAAQELTAEAREFRFAPAATPGASALVVYPTVQFYDGRGANRSWMQELPDPVTRNVWGSWVELHPETAEGLGVRHGDLVEVRSEAGTVEAPAYLYRGIRPDTVAIPLGQGHTAYGRYARRRGVNPLDLLPAGADERSGALAFAGVSVELRATGRRARLVNLQGHDTDLGRQIAEIGMLEETRRQIEDHRVDPAELHEASWDSDPASPYRWGMTVDLNACVGCGACVTACYAENNIPTVGEERAARGREMSWLRVSRYWKETEDGGFVTVHQPTMCQHCGDAPCEPVCPVYATYHTSEGLNAQVYNRCVGTRYCSNNCPYKVRRFNWFTYDFPYPLNLQLNPDVTVRSKGVMEKCTFCVQRIQRAKMDAKEEGRQVRDGEVATACQQTCPAGAIIFGNLKDPESEVSRLARGVRGYGMLAGLGTRPGVVYLQDVTQAQLTPVERYRAVGATPYRDVRPGTHEHRVPAAPDAERRRRRDVDGEEGSR